MGWYDYSQGFLHKTIWFQKSVCHSQRHLAIVYETTLFNVIKYLLYRCSLFRETCDWNLIDSKLWRIFAAEGGHTGQGCKLTWTKCKLFELESEFGTCLDVNDKLPKEVVYANRDKMVNVHIHDTWSRIEDFNWPVWSITILREKQSTTLVLLINCWWRKHRKGVNNEPFTRLTLSTIRLIDWHSEIR